MNARLARPVRPPVAELVPFEALDRTHAEVLAQLKSLARLVDRLADHGVDAQAQALAGSIVDFFNQHARQHHAEEERLVFPALLASTDVELQQHVRRLQQDHGWLEEDWLEIAPQLEAVARGYNWYDLAMLQHALPIFESLYREHIALEESLVYPEAKRRREALAAGGAARSALA